MGVGGVWVVNRDGDVLAEVWEGSWVRVLVFVTLLPGLEEVWYMQEW